MFGNFNNVKVQTFGERTFVPDDDVAKLMYYLSCVDTVINYNEIDRLSDYENYDLLSVDSLTELFKLVLLFNPEIFIEAGIFILDENLLIYGMDNQFYQITDERIGIHVNNEIMIGGRTVKVLKVMACNESWLIRNYYRPWKNIFELTEKYQRKKTHIMFLHLLPRSRFILLSQSLVIHHHQPQITIHIHRIMCPVFHIRKRKKMDVNVVYYFR